MSGRLRAVGPEGARGVVSWMRAGPGGSGTSDGGGRPAAGAPGPRTQAGCRAQEDRRPLPRDCEYAHRPPRAGRDRAWAPRGPAGAPTILGQRPGGGPLVPHPGDPRSGRAEGLSSRPQGFGPLPGTAFCPCFSAPGQAGVVGGPGVSHSGPEGRSQLQKGSSLASPAVRIASCPVGGRMARAPDGQSPSVHPGRGSLSRAPRPPQERETLGHAHFTAESTEGPEAPCVVCGAPIPRGTHARGTRRLRQAGRGRPQAPGPGLPVCPPVHCGPLCPKWALP